MLDRMARLNPAYPTSRRLYGRLLRLCAPPLLAGLSACAETGDFGRTPYSVLDDKIIPEVTRSVTHSRGDPVSWYRHTEAETRLRKEAEKLVLPYGRPVFLERTIRRVENANLVSNRIDWNAPGHYVARLDREKFKSGTARVRMVTRHMEDDRHFMIRFEKAMVEVLRADDVRARHLRANSDYPEAERRNAEVRIEENRAVMHKAIKAMDQRIDGYDDALHITPLRFPGTDMRGARRLLIDLSEYNKALDARLKGFKGKAGKDEAD